MIIQNIDGISFQMREASDFSFLCQYGQVFCVFSRNDSGNISFGVDDGRSRYFIKIAGAKTARSCTDTEESVASLKNSVPLYADLAHPSLIRMVDHFAHGDLYVAVFRWVDGDWPASQPQQLIGTGS